MTQKVLIMGLPGAGKTTLAQQVVQKLRRQGHSVSWLNADQVRDQWNDWDFSHDGRVRQSMRMREIADKSTSDYLVCDFVCPLPIMRDHFAADFVVWVDTVTHSRFADTNAMFVPPTQYHLRICEQDADRYSELVTLALLAK